MIKGDPTIVNIPHYIWQQKHDKCKNKNKQKKIDDTETKIAKLTNYLTKENPIFKHKITLLSNFRNSYHTRDSFDKLLNSIQFYLINKEITE